VVQGTNYGSFASGGEEEHFSEGKRPRGEKEGAEWKDTVTAGGRKFLVTIYIQGGEKGRAGS